MTSIIPFVLTDTPVTMNEDINEHLDIAERASGRYNEAKARTKLRTMLHSHLPPGAEDPIIPTDMKRINKMPLALCALLHESVESVAQTRFEAANGRFDHMKRQI